MRKKKSIVTKTYTTLLMCKPLDYGEIGLKPRDNVSQMIQWKINCRNISYKCCENARSIFVQAGCKNNLTKTSLTTTKNVELMTNYINKMNEQINAVNNETTDHVTFV